MRDLIEKWILNRTLLLETLEARFCFSATSESVVLIDKTLPNDSLLTRAIVPGGKTILYDGAHESAAEVLARTTQWAQVAGIKISSISLLAHASAGKFELGNQWISNKTLDATAQAWESLGQVMARGGSINLFGCNLASTTGNGNTLINRIAALTGAGVHASNNLTGRGGDWVLEAASSGAAAQPLDAPLNLAALAQWNSTLAPGITVTPTSPQTTTEAGGTATFDIVLDEAPGLLDTVTVPISSDNTAEGTVSVSSVTFNALNWNTPQTVTVTGVNDDVDDGDQNYNVVTGPATSTDLGYDGIDPNDVALTNTDDDTAGITVTPTAGLVTTEAGGTDTFDVVLNSQPTADVTITIVSTNTTEGTVNKSTLTFTSANWNTAQTVTITGQNDAVDDGNIAYSITTGVAASSDPNYNGLDPSDVAVSNTDNDTAGITVTPTSGLTTTEAGGQASFNVSLTSQPTSTVTIAISSSDSGEGTVSTSLLTFTTLNWSTPQTVTVTGVDDFVDDGNIGYTIITAPASSSDGVYNGINAANVTVTNTDDDTAGITVTPTSGLTTTEAGAQATFTVVLTSQPTSAVTIGISSSDLTEGTVSAASLTFNSGNWNTPQTVTITGVDDFAVDGSVGYTIVTAAAASSDGKYSGMNPANVSVTNTDNDAAGITVTPTSGLFTTEAGGADTFDVVLTSQPSGNVTIPISSSNTAEGTVSTASLVFTNANWNVPQTVTVTGVDDFVDDGNIAYNIITGAATSSDGNYNGLNPANVSASNVDDDTAGVTVSPTSGLTTTEAGSQTSFDVVLTSQPTASVTIGINSLDTTEGTVSTASLVFTTANWNVPQTVTITSVDDATQDGDITYTVNTANATSSDPKYSNFNVANVTVTNYDNDPTGTTSSPEFPVNTATSSDQQTFSPNARAVASDGNGNFVVVWSSLNQDGSSWGVYGQRFDSNSNAIGSEFLINQSTSNAQQYAHVATDLAGDFVVTWSSNLQDGSGWGIYARTYNSSGVAQTSEFRVNTATSGDQQFSDVAMDSTGNFVIVWTGVDASGKGVFAQRYNAAGVAQGGEFRANSTTTSDQFEPAVGMDYSGNFVIVWTSNGQDGGGYGVYGQRYNAAGTAQGSEFRANTTTANDQRYPSIGLDSTGNFVIVWSSIHGSGNFNGVYGQRYNSAGVAQGAEFQVNQDTNRNEQAPSISLDSDGDFVVTWSADHGSGGSWAVYAQQYDSSATKRGGQFLVNTYTLGDQQYPAVSLDPIGDYAIVWTSNGEDGSGQGVYGRLYYGGNNPPVNSVPAAQSVPEDSNLVFSAGNGNLISISDPDAGNNSVQVTLTATNGLLTLSGTSGLTFTIGDGTSDATMTLTGMIANINAALAGMTFSPTSNFNGAATININTDDLGNFGWGTSQADNDTVNINVNAVNDPPSVTVPAAQTMNEDGTLTLSSGNGNLVSISDIDAASGAVRVTLTGTNGVLTLSTLSGLSFVTGDGTADATMTFTGTLANVNAALAGMTFAPNTNFNGVASFQVVANDQGNTGSGGSLTDTKSVSITVNPVNDPPVNSLPAAQSVNEDTNLVFSSGNGNLISISDLDAGGSSVQVTLTVTNGSLTLSTLSGLSFVTGDGTADTTMTFTGSVANINAALAGMFFSPTTNYNGAASLQIVTNDLGNSGSGGALSDTDTLAITVNPVNDPPVNSLPAAQSVNEDTNLVFSSGNGNLISISDLDAGGSSVQVTLTVTNGSLTLSTLSGLSFVTGDGTADTTMTFTGTVANINAALAGMFFSPTTNYNGAASLQIVTNDLGNSGSGGALSDTDTLAITVNPVNDPPVNSLPAAQSVNEDTNLVFSSGNGNLISISDLDAGGSSVQVTLTVTNGSLTLSTLSGLSFVTGDGTADTTMSFTGSVANINAALAGMFFSPTANYNGAASLQIVTNDLGNSGSGGALSDTDTLAITVNPVNDPPVNSVPGAQSVNEDGVLTFSSGNSNLISISDLDAASGSLQITLTATHGVLNLSGLTGLSFTVGDGVADATMTFTGTLANINAALAGMTFAPNADYNGAATVQISTNDQGNTGSGGSLIDTDTVNVTVNAVNDAPINTVPAAQTTNEDTPLIFSTANGNLIAVNDIDAASGNVQVTLTAANGTLTLADLTGLSFSLGDGTADATMTFTGTLASVNAALDGMIFAPNANVNGSGSVQITTNDLGNTGIGGALTDTDTVNITLNAINDAPVISAPASDATNEDTALVFKTANGNLISITDVDSAAGALQVTLTVTHGTLDLAGLTGLTFTVGDGSGDATMTFTGTLANINAALNGLTFNPTLNYNGAASLSVAVNDQGNTGAGGPLNDSTSVALTVNAVNDAPVNTVPGAQSVNEDGLLTFSSGNGNAISIFDLDVASGTMQVTLTSTNGTLTLGATTGLSFTVGDGTGDATMTFTGTMAAINAAINGLGFAPTADYNGPATVQITTSDLGNTGIGGALSDTDTVNVTVNAVNDAPINTVPPAQSTNEDTTLVFSSGNGNLIAITDIDAASGPLQVTLTVTHGTLTLASLAGLTFTTGDGTGDATMTFTGTLTNINAALNGMGYTPTLNYNGPASLQITTSDQGNTGIGGALGDSDSVAITVNAVNDAPVNTLPVAQIVDEDTQLVLSTANGNNLSISDVDENGGILRVTLAVTNGTLTLGGTTGLTFITGNGAADTTMTFTGTLVDINAAIDGLMFDPNANYNGPATLTITSNDQGNSGLGGAQTTVSNLGITVAAVNDPPTAVVPSPQITDEDIDLVFSPGNGNPVTVGDVDAGASFIEVTLVATHGSLSLSGVTGITFITGDGVFDTTMVIRGQMSDLNAALSGLTFSPASNYNGPATIQITTDDLGNNGSGGAHTATASVDVTINAINDAPVINLPVAQSTNEDTDLVFTAGGGNGISISDVDVAGGLMQVTLSVGHGKLTLSGTTGLTFSNGDGAGDVAMTFTGTLADINAALEGMTFSPDLNYNGPETLNVTVDDRGNVGAGGILGDAQGLPIAVVAVNDGPVNTVPSAQTTNEDTPITFSTGNGNALSIFDLDENGGMMQVTLTAPDGALTLGSLTGLTFTVGDGAADGTMTFSGTMADINAALQGLVFSPGANFNGATTIQMTTSDLGNTGLGGALTDTDTINITVNPINDAPVNTVPAAQSTNEDISLVFSAANGNAISIGDVDATTLRVTLTVDHGTLTLSGVTGLTFASGDGTGDATMTFTGTLADINAALEGLTYKPFLNYNGPATLQLFTSDLGQTGAGATLTDSDSVAITVNAVNDPPVNTVPGSQSVQEDNTLVFNFANGNRILVSDLESGSSTIRVTLSATNGVITLAGTNGLIFTAGDGTDDATMTFLGTINEINAAMEGLSFRPLHDFAGAASLQITTNDRGHTGIGGAQATTDVIAITVNLVNDAPVVTATPGGITYTENDPATVIDPGMLVGDVDDTNLTAATVAIVGYVPGEDVLQFVDQNGITGSWDAEGGVLTLMGNATLANYQAALQSITYVNASDNPTGGTRSVVFVVGDGALRSDPVQRTITVVPVNDGPTSTPLVQTIQEDAGRTAIDLRALFADAEDPDSALTLEIVHTTDKSLFASMRIDPQTGQLILDSAHDAFGQTTITIRATDSGGLVVETTIDLTVAPVNDAAVVTLSPGTTEYASDALNVIVDKDLKLNDVDSTTIASATVHVLNSIPLRDELNFVDQNGITGSYDFQTGTLTLTGVATVAEYEAALRSVTYTNHLGGSPFGEERGIEITVNDGVTDSLVRERVIEWPALGSILPPIVAHGPDGSDDHDLPAPSTKGHPSTSPPAHTHTPQAPGTVSSGGVDGNPPALPPAPAPVQLPSLPPVPPPLARAQVSATPVVIAPPPPPPPAPPIPVVAPPPPAPVYHAETLWKELDALSKDLDTQTHRGVVSVGSVAGMTTTLLSVGYVVWCLRGGSLVATLLTTLPLWKWLDPLPVLDHQDEEDRKREAQRDEDEERLRSMME